jgi:hypothetical protein
MENEKNWYDDFTNYVISKWKEKGNVSNEEDTRESLDAMMYLLSGYRLKCLIATLIDIDDLMEKFEKEHPEYNEDEECDCDECREIKN